MDPSLAPPHSGSVTRRPLQVRCWGARGSIPTPGALTTRYGGNTSCVEILAGGRRLIFDAGSGLRKLGETLIGEGASHHLDVFLSHFHWDHIQGFPFFAPLYNPAVQLHIRGPAQEGLDIQTLFAGQMGPVYFPVPFGVVAAHTSFQHLNEGLWEEDEIRVRPFRVRHASFTVGYRIDVDGRSVAYLPDNELGAGGNYPVGGATWDRELRDFLTGCDILIHDSMYTEEEYEGRQGWGHSTYRQVLGLAREAQVGKLILFHHAPERSDDELDRLTAELEEESSATGGPQIEAAKEGAEWLIPQDEAAAPPPRVRP